jgi:hypothetical protein
LTYVNIGAVRFRHSGRTDLPRQRSPAAFQLVRIAVEIDGKKFQEMPVYRGAIAQLFLYPPSVDNSTSGVHVLAVHGRRI